MTSLTAALLQLTPDKQYILPSSSTSTSFNQGLSTYPDGDMARNSTKNHKDIYAGPHGLSRTSDQEIRQHRNANLGIFSSHVTANTYHGGRRLGEHTPDGHVLSTSATRTNEGSKCSRTDNEMIWQAVLENVQSDSLRKMMAKEGLVISVSLCTGNSSAGQVVWRPSQSHRAGHCVFRPPIVGRKQRGYGKLPVYQYLVEVVGMEVNNPDTAQDLTPIEHAINYGNLPAISYLLDHGADLHQQRSGDITLLQLQSGPP